MDLIILPKDHGRLNDHSKSLPVLACFIASVATSKIVRKYLFYCLTLI